MVRHLHIVRRNEAFQEKMQTFFSLRNIGNLGFVLESLIFAIA